RVGVVGRASGGRIDFSVGAGPGTHEYATFGLDAAERSDRLFESLGVIRRCFSEETFDHDGQFYQFREVRLTTRPLQASLPMSVSVADEATLQRVARAGYHVAGGPIERRDPPEGVEAYRAAGRDPDAFNLSVYTSGHVAATRELALAESEIGLGHFHNNYLEQHARPGAAPAVAWREMPVGTPDEVLRILEST